MNLHRSAERTSELLRIRLSLWLDSETLGMLGSWFVISPTRMNKRRSSKRNSISQERQRRSSGLVLPLFKASLCLTLQIQTELLRIARTNFSEAMQILVHLKVVQLFVESVLRYGLPAEYTGLVVKVSLFTPYAIAVLNGLYFPLA